MKEKIVLEAENLNIEDNSKAISNGKRKISSLNLKLEECLKQFELKLVVSLERSLQLEMDLT